MRVRLSGSGNVLGSVAALAVLAVLAAPGGPATAQPDPTDFVTIGAPGNAPWPGNGTPGDRAIGRGGVNYEYRIGRYEVTTAQWVEFFNAAYDRPPSEWLPHLRPPDFWGAQPTTPNTPGGRRWMVPPGNEMRPTGNISWRMAAMYANWLHNDMNLERSAFLDGAYDVSTFGYQGSSGIFTDQLRHHPDARYWVPTWDEWLKAAHYDPDRNGPGAGGWWVYDITSDVQPVYGPPGVLVNGRPTQANAGWDDRQFPGHNPFTIPLGAYPTVQSPWGLFDAAGGTTEWTEETVFIGGFYPTYRVADGSAWALAGASVHDQPYGVNGDSPSFSAGYMGFRMAARIPGPATCVPIAVMATLYGRRRAASVGGTPPGDHPSRRRPRADRRGAERVVREPDRPRSSLR